MKHDDNDADKGLSSSSTEITFGCMFLFSHTESELHCFKFISTERGMSNFNDETADVCAFVQTSKYQVMHVGLCGTRK